MSADVVDITKKPRNLVLIDLEKFAAGNKKNYETYMQVVSHASPLLKKAIAKAYADGIDDTCKLLDRVKSE